jgi:hypothetical protein
MAGKLFYTLFLREARLGGKMKGGRKKCLSSSTSKEALWAFPYAWKLKQVGEFFSIHRNCRILKLFCLLNKVIKLLFILCTKRSGML